MRSRVRSGLAAVAVVAALTATSCSKATSTGSAGSVRTGPGVTDTTIVLGALTDLTGVYATLGKSMTQAQQLYFDQLNEAGGVCGRKIEMVVRDHGYDVQRAVAAYAEIADTVVGLPQMIGSPVVDALLPEIERDHLLTVPTAWPSTLLKENYVQVVGGTYDLEMINAVGFLTQQKGIVRGDKLGHVYFEGGYGGNALSGAKYAAAQAGLTVVEQRVKPTDTDMTAQVAALKSAGVKAILLSVGPQQSASIAGVAAAARFNVPIVSSNPGYAPQLLATKAAPALLANFYVLSSVQTANAGVSGMQALVTAYEKKFPGSPVDSGTAFGYVAAQLFGESLKIACTAKDLSREGVLAALRTMKSFESGGIMAPLDFSKPGQVGTYLSFLQRPHADAKGGLVPVDELFALEAASGAYIFPR